MNHNGLTSSTSSFSPLERSGFRRAQWRILFATMFCYLFYYTGRQNIGWAIKAFSDELNLTKTETGWIAGAALACYGIGQAINGNLGDKFGGRRLMSLGAILSCALNWVTSFGHSFWSILVPWTANGYVQSLGWAPGSRLISNWWPCRERGKAFGFYVFAAGFSTVLTYFLCILVLSYFSWPWVFRLPVLLMPLGAVVFYLVARNRPEELGYEPLRDEIEKAEETNEAEQETILQRYTQVLKNRRFLVACLAIGFESWARYGLVTWVPIHYLGDDWKQNLGSVWITLALPIGMALGALTAGHISDWLFHSNRSRPIALFLAAASVITLTIYFVPAEYRIVGMILLFLAGFFVYGPQSSFWALCPDLLGRRRAGTGVGVMDACAYGAAAIGQLIIGYVMDLTNETGSVFLITSLVCVLGVACIVFVRR